jgi:hypothetical protein
MISIDKLNENQLKAVNHLDGPCMVQDQVRERLEL